VSGIGLWSILHPRIERYLDDPSRTQKTRATGVMSLDSDATSHASTAGESDLAARDLAHGSATAQSRAA
jgi:hypothetical protein